MKKAFQILTLVFLLFALGLTGLMRLDMAKASWNQASPAAAAETPAPEPSPSPEVTPAGFGAAADPPITPETSAIPTMAHAISAAVLTRRLLSLSVEFRLPDRNVSLLLYLTLQDPYPCLFLLPSILL